MTVEFTLFIDGSPFGRLNTAIWMKPENALLEEVFPELTYWDKDSPVSFDFAANEVKVKNAVAKYFAITKNSPKGNMYISPSIERRGEAHLASPKETEAMTVSFVENFLEIYKIGLESQRKGKRTSVMLTS